MPESAPNGPDHNDPTDCLVIVLRPVRLWRSQDEYRDIIRASCGDVMDQGDGPVVRNVARQLLWAGHDPATIIKVQRDGVDAFLPQSLGAWVQTRGELTPALVKAQAALAAKRGNT